MTASDVLAFSPDGKLLAASLLTGGVRVFDAATGTALRTLADPGNETVSLAFAPNGDLLAAGTLAGTVELWDPVTGKRIAQPLLADSSAISDIAFDPQRPAVRDHRFAGRHGEGVVHERASSRKVPASPRTPTPLPRQPSNRAGRACSSSTISVVPSPGRCRWRVGSSAPARLPVETSPGPSGHSSSPDRGTRPSAVDGGPAGGRPVPGYPGSARASKL